MRLRRTTSRILKAFLIYKKVTLTLRHTHNQSLFKYAVFDKATNCTSEILFWVMFAFEITHPATPSEIPTLRIIDTQLAAIGCQTDIFADVVTWEITILLPKHQSVQVLKCKRKCFSHKCTGKSKYFTMKLFRLSLCTNQL